MEIWSDFLSPCSSIKCFLLEEETVQQKISYKKMSDGEESSEYASGNRKWREKWEENELLIMHPRCHSGMKKEKKKKFTWALVLLIFLKIQNKHNQSHIFVETKTENNEP